MCTELKVPLHGQPRISADREDFMAKWNELSNYNMGGLLRLFGIHLITSKFPDLANYRPVYAPKDLLEVLLSLKGPAKTTENTEWVLV